MEIIDNLKKGDFDSPWKEILEDYFAEFVAFFFPQAYEEIFWQELNQYDKEGKYMPYVMSIERIAMEKGMEKGEQQGIRQMLLDALEAKFEIIPEKLLEKINNITNKNILKILHRYVIKCNSLKEFEENLNQF